MQTQVLQSAYSHGSVQDLARYALPAGAAWKIVDLIPDYFGAPLQKRGPWGYAYGPFSDAGAQQVLSIAYCPFTTGDQVVAINSSGKLFNGNTSMGITPSSPAASRPVFFQNLLIVPGATITKYDGSAAPVALPGAPANGTYIAAYKQRLVAAVNDTLHFCAPGDPTTWGALSTIGTTYPITGIAALRNMIAVFSKGHTERVIGATPPSSTSAGDMSLEPLFDQGCLDARTIVTIDDKMIWANGNGVWISDGAASENLIELGGMRQYWQTLMKSYAPTAGSRMAAGVYQGRYIISIMNGLTGVDTMMCNLSTKTWTFLSNIHASMFAEALGTSPELYMAIGDGDLHVGRLSNMFNLFINAPDGNGTFPAPVLETPFYRGAPMSKRWRNLYLGLDFKPNLGAGYLTVEYVTSTDSTTYTLVTNPDGSTFKILPTGGYQRTKVPLSVVSDGIGLRISQVGPSTSLGIFDIEAEMRAREGLRGDV